MSAALTPRVEGVVTLADGRDLGYAEYGAPDGRAVFWFHGTPGARRQVPPGARLGATERDLRIIAVERPGIGASTPHLYDDVRGFARDIAVVADRLEVDEFACIGLSGGGPYVLACAHAHPKRMRVGVVLGGVAPTTGPEAAPGGVVGMLRRFAPVLGIARAPLGRAAGLLVRALVPLRSPLFELYRRTSPPGDRELFAKPEMKAMFVDDLVRGSRTQLHAPFLDLVLFTRDWGFSVREIRVPIRFYHGTGDHIVPFHHARHLAALVPDSVLRVRSGESHMGTLDAADEILDTVLGLWELPTRKGPRRRVRTTDFGATGI
ncbi:MAG: alpha/beta fold hydrolase [Actinomycetota bacterium]